MAQIIGGFISGSLALISDALHNFSDVISLILSLLVHRLSKRKQIKYGLCYKRAEIIAAFINSKATFNFAAFFDFMNSIIRFSHPVLGISSELVIWLSILGIAFNGFSVLILKKNADHNLNMKSACLHLLQI